MRTARRPKFSPGAVRRIAAEQDYSEREVGDLERSYKISFSHRARYGGGGPDHQVDIISI